VAANLFGRVDTVVEVGDEAGDGPLEVDVVLPEGVIGVDEEGLVGGTAHWLSGCGGRGLRLRGHGSIIGGLRSFLYEGGGGMPRLGDI
jgi:hypothetical protein